MLRLIGRRCNRHEWIRTRMAGSDPNQPFPSRHGLDQLVRSVRDAGLVTIATEPGPRIIRSGQLYELTEQGRRALSAG